MKKIALILIISVYAISTLGVGLTQFYCCGKLQSTSISLIQNTNQKAGTANEKDGCCKNKFQYIKIKDSHVKADYLNSPVKYFTELNLYTSSFYDIAFAPLKVVIANRSNAPPLHSVPAYIYNCVFRI